MKAGELKVGDRIRITGVPTTKYHMPLQTAKVFKQLAARKRSVRISEIDEWGSPSYLCKFKRPNGTWIYHFLTVIEGEDNWVLVKKRNKHEEEGTG